MKSRDNSYILKQAELEASRFTEEQKEEPKQEMVYHEYIETKIVSDYKQPPPEIKEVAEVRKAPEAPARAVPARATPVIIEEPE